MRESIQKCHHPGKAEKKHGKLTKVLIRADELTRLRKAANAHDGLVAALDDTLRYLVTPAGFPDAGKRTAEQQRAYDNALAAIRGQE